MEKKNKMTKCECPGFGTLFLAAVLGGAMLNLATIPVSPISSTKLSEKSIKSGETTITGKPLYAQTSTSDKYVRLEISIIPKGQEEPVLCSDWALRREGQAMDLATLINVHINSFNPEPIQVTGKYVDLGYGKQIFDITSVKVDGYDIKIDTEK